MGSHQSSIKIEKPVKQDTKEKETTLKEVPMVKEIEKLDIFKAPSRFLAPPIIATWFSN